MDRILRFWLVFALLMAAVEVSYAIAACDAVAGFDYREAKNARSEKNGTKVT